MRVTVLTYQAPHRKTYDALCLLKVRGYDDVSVVATPLTYVKRFQPLVRHRPDMVFRVPSTWKVCGSFGYAYEEQDGYEGLEPDGPVLVCGAGILPDAFVRANRVVNAHPGLIPYARGLDALKWAIYEGYPIGATTHFIGEEVDAGEIIERRKVDILPDDTILSLGMRVYAEEIDMLVGSLELLDAPHDFASGGESAVHRRMPREIEPEMLKRFEERKASL